MKTAARCGIWPDTFWRLTYGEVMICAEAHGENIRTMQEIAAFAAASIMNVWLKRQDRVTPDKLLGRKKSESVLGEMRRRVAARKQKEAEEAEARERARVRSCLE